MSGGIRSWTAAAFIATAVASLLIGGLAPLVFASVAIGTIGMAHGASDAALVAPERRAAFLGTYLVVVALVFAAWRLAPAAALVGFLIVSAIHFGLDDAPADAPVERVARGLLAVAAPAVLHRTTLATLFAGITGRPDAAMAIAAVLALVGMLALTMLPPALASVIRREGLGGAVLLATGTAAALLLTPLAGFAVSFVLLHAWPQWRRQLERSMTTSASYVRRHAATLAGAAMVMIVAVPLFADRLAAGSAALFAAIAALAVPHIIVTPWFARRAPDDGVRPIGALAAANG